MLSSSIYRINLDKNENHNSRNTYINWVKSTTLLWLENDIIKVQKKIIIKGISNEKDHRLFNFSLSFCDMAKALLTREGFEFEAINLDNDHELRMKLSEENNGYRTVPMIFIDDKFIGGSKSFKNYIKDGRLK